MQDITNRLNCAKIIIRNLVAGGRVEPHLAVNYACEFIDLPADIVNQLSQYAIGMSNRN